ncbi:uncharacterized protein [Macrobrachium rosenbergii]|uniref:uncharacterized protein n=1 Tax=Macrobrachium rosenbergii TaxID=79674 RepID=UPI0034D4387E
MDPMFLCESCGGYLGDENRQPKILYCGHSFCTYCVADFFEDDAVHCFKCGFKHHAKSTTRIPVNHILLKIIKSKEMSNERVVGPMTMPQGNTQETYLSHHEPWSSYPGRKNSHTQTVFGEPVQHAGKCVKHTLYCTLWCRRCKEWICQDCRLVSHPPVSCKVLTLSEALKEIKLEENYCIKRTVELFESHVVIYREKLSHLREMNGKHRSLIKDLQTLLGKHRKLEREVEKRELTIQESLATGFSMLLMLLESQSHLLEAKGLGEVLLARQSAQGCQSAILGWYEPKLLDDTEEITISDGFQKGTMAAMTVLKHSMGLSFNQRVADEASDFTSFTGNDQEELVMCVKHMMESPYWKVILGKIESDDTVDGNSMYRLAQGAQRIDSRLYDFDGRIYYNARSRFSRSTNVYVEKLIDISTGSAEGSDVWYQKYRKPGLLAERGGRVYGEPFSTSLLDEITDDCYYQLRSEISQHASGAEGECPEGLTGKFKDAKQQGAFPEHMIPLTPTKDRNELQLGLTRTETSRDATGYPKGFFMKPLEAEGKDIYKKEPRGRSMPAHRLCDGGHRPVYLGNRSR